MKQLLFFIALIACSALSAQTAPDKYWVQFTDKEDTPFTLDNPEQFLSPKALARRNLAGTSVNNRDLPIDPDYIAQVLAVDTSISLVHQSKWFNAITIHTADSLIIETIAALPIVNQTRSVQQFQVDFPEIPDERLVFHSENFYGPSFRQIEMLGGNLLHELGYHGEGMEIAVMDAGWINLYKLPVFDRLISEERILSTHDFVLGGSSVHYYHDHGMYVLSTMAGWMPDSLIGTAYGANYRLYRTEDVFSENVVEEDHWIAAIEHADSAGVQVVNTSLGYSLFDDSLAHHIYADMDGNTTRISIAADWAAERGMLLVNSAGNSGDDPWHYITAPADADSILAVGAVGADEQKAGFSSFGPTFDGRIKPDVMAMGLKSVIAAHDSTIRTGNGTSFASPILCGLAACLWQAHPDKSNMDIIEAIRKSSSLYYNPNDSLGYGIPNFYAAHQLLSSGPTGGFIYSPTFEVYPNPFIDHITIQLGADDFESIDIRMYDSVGREMEIEFEMTGHNTIYVRTTDDLFLHKPHGVFYLDVEIDGLRSVRAVVKG